jgi:hypothetical protein
MIAAKDGLQGLQMSVALEGGFLCSFSEYTRGIHDSLRQGLPSMFIVHWSSISVTPMIMQSMYLGLFDG